MSIFGSKNSVFGKISIFGSKTTVLDKISIFGSEVSEQRKNLNIWLEKVSNWWNLDFGFGKFSFG